MAVEPVLVKIVKNLRTTLATGTGLSIQRIGLVARRTVPNLDGDKDILLRIRGFSAVSGQADRIDFRVRRTIDITMRHRLTLDPTGRDYEWLTKDALGFLLFEETVLDTMQMWEPMDADTLLPLLVQPARVLSGTDPSKDEPSADNTSWGQETLSYEIVYKPGVDTCVS